MMCGSVSGVIMVAAIVVLVLIEMLHPGKSNGKPSLSLEAFELKVSTDTLFESQVSNGVFKEIVVSSDSKHRVVRNTRGDSADKKNRRWKWLKKMQRLRDAYNSTTSPELEMEKTTKSFVPMSLEDLYAVECELKLISDHTFHRELGTGDVDFTARFMTSLIRRVDGLFRRIDIDGNGRSNEIGFRIKDTLVFDDPGSSSYPLKSEELTSQEVLERITMFASRDICFCVVFMVRSFSDNSIGRAFSWNSENEEVGGVCGNKESPNVGFVNLERNGWQLSTDLSIVATARTLAMALGGQLNGPECSNTSVLVDPFPVSLTTETMTLSSCDIQDIKDALSERSSCFLDAFPHILDDDDDKDQCLRGHTREVQWLLIKILISFCVTIAWFPRGLLLV